MTPPALITIGTTKIYYGKVEMITPAGSPHVRSQSIRIPHKFTIKPTVNLTIYPPNGGGVMFVIYDLKIVDLSGSVTQVSFDASNVQIGAASNENFWCDYIIIGI